MPPPNEHIVYIYENPDRWTLRLGEPLAFKVTGAPPASKASGRWQVHVIECKGLNPDHVKKQDRTPLLTLLQSALEEVTGRRVMQIQWGLLTQ